MKIKMKKLKKILIVCAVFLFAAACVIFSFRGVKTTNILASAATITAESGTGEYETPAESESVCVATIKLNPTTVSNFTTSYTNVNTSSSPTNGSDTFYTGSTVVETRLYFYVDKIIYVIYTYGGTVPETAHALYTYDLDTRYLRDIYFTTDSESSVESGVYPVLSGYEDTYLIPYILITHYASDYDYSTGSLSFSFISYPIGLTNYTYAAYQTAYLAGSNNGEIDTSSGGGDSGGGDSGGGDSGGGSSGGGDSGDDETDYTGTKIFENALVTMNLYANSALQYTFEKLVPNITDAGINFENIATDYNDILAGTTYNIGVYIAVADYFNYTDLSIIYSGAKFRSAYFVTSDNVYYAIELVESSAGTIFYSEIGSDVEIAQIYLYYAYSDNTGNYNYLLAKGLSLTYTDYIESEYSKGYNAGYLAGIEAGNSDYYDAGYEYGYQEGYQSGAAAGNEVSTSLFYGALSMLSALFDNVTVMLSTEIAPGINIGLIVIGIPCAFLVLELVISLILKFFGKNTGGGGDE